MEIKGDEFVKKVQFQQEREELEKKLSELEEAESNISETNVIKEENTIPNEHELDNIMLDTPENPQEDNKKKYLVLGIVLVVLFLLTIIIIRLLTQDSTKDDSFTSKSTESTEMKKLEENSKIEDDFQKIINERIKKDKEAISSKQTSEEKIEAVTTTQENQEKRDIADSTLDETIKKIEKKTTKEEKKVEKKVVQKEKPKATTKEKRSIKQTVQKASKSQTTGVTKGYFVQIGAFKKKPSDSYINKIRNAGFKYKIYQVEVKGTLYNKLLIGPYSSRAKANEDINNIKTKLNLSSAYILKF